MALSAVRMLQDEHQVIVNPVMYPAVPYGTSIIRMTASALHTPAQMERLVAAIVAVSAKLPLHEENDAAAHKAGGPVIATESNGQSTNSSNGQIK
jgi:hypothetical protein